MSSAKSLLTKTVWNSILGILCMAPQILLAQADLGAIRTRGYAHEVIPKTAMSSPPGYCESYGGSTGFERISSVSVVEKAGNILDITVEVFIANPTGCVSGEPCPVYDASPEHVNVWIDWDGDLTWEPHEKIEQLNRDLTGYGNINYSGSMTARGQVEIPSNATRPTWLRANLGWGYDPESPCELTWGYGNVVDQQVLWGIRVQEITATLDVEIPDVPKPLWQAAYDAAGGIISVVADRPVSGGMKNGWLTLPVKLISFPGELGSDARTTCKWQVMGTGISGEAGINGKEGVIRVTLPQRIGVYQLKLDFTFRGAQSNRLGDQEITIPLWVTFDKPILPAIKRAWLERALQWTAGSADTDQMAMSMMNSIHQKSGWKYINTTKKWDDLVEGRIDHGLCTNMATVWVNLLKTLGVPDVSNAGHMGRLGNGFMSHIGYVALGAQESSNGNAAPDYTLFPTYDRWFFGSHHFGKKGETYFDPTFNVTGSDFYFHIAYDVSGSAPGALTTPAGGPTIHSDGSFEFDQGNWSKFWYEFAAGKALSKSLAQGAHFTGTFSDVSVDADGDGRFENLTVTVGVEITTEGEYTVVGVLRKNGEIITSRPFYVSADSWSAGIGPQLGQVEVAPAFSGEEILRHAVDGPYEITLAIIGSGQGVVDSTTFVTTPNEFADFGELPAHLVSISETARDRSGDGLFDEIEVDLSVNAYRSGDYTISVALAAEGKVLSSSSRSFALTAGSNALEVILPAENMAAAGRNGPYDLSLQVRDAQGEQSDFGEMQTAPYSLNQFASPAIYVTGGSSDFGLDVNGNGFFDSLEVSLDMDVNRDGVYAVRAWLEDANGEQITWAHFEKLFVKGSERVTLRFPGTVINESGLDGPYVVSYLAVTDEAANLIFSGNEVYITGEYSAALFEPEEAALISSTGNYFEAVVDSDLDGLIDSLIIGIEVVPRDVGNVVAIGRLVDSEGNTILWTDNSEFLQAEVAQNVHLRFDGRYIFGGLLDGPYHLRNLQVYHVGDPGQSIDINEAFSTASYGYDDFEKAGVITGVVRDSLGVVLPNALVAIRDVDSDISNDTGKYNLVIVNDGDYVVKIDGPDTTDPDWSIFVDEEFVGRGDSVQVSLTTDDIVQIDFRGRSISTGVEERYAGSTTPSDYQLSQNYPNPFNEQTWIGFDLPKPSQVGIEIYNVLGQRVRKLLGDRKPAGTYGVVWDGRLDDGAIAPAGVYVCRFSANDHIATRTLLRLK